MKITSKKLISHKERVVNLDDYEIRVRFKNSKIVTIICMVEDGEVNSWEGKTDLDKKELGKLSTISESYLEELIDGINF